MAAFRPLQIANAVLDEADAQSKSLTVMQLLKLTYIAHGWSLGLLGAPLVDEQAEAWQHGPVFPDVYRAFRRFGSGPISGRASTPFGPMAPANLSDLQAKIIRSVVSSYGDMHAFTLSRMTHQDGTPWSETFRSGAGSSDAIPDALIADHYRKLARERHPAS